MAEKIDAVFTWVDGTDPVWQAKKEQALKNKPSYEQTKDADVTKRFFECNELYYSINLLRCNAPWLHRIYLVTDCQRPSWLKKSEAKRLGVTIVDHTDIFSDHTDMLPTFNSQSIETMLVNIPGLSEKFIYLNDDTLVVRPVKPEDFFFGEILVIRGRWGLKNSFTDKVLRRLTRPWSVRGYVCRSPGMELLSGLIRYIDLAHAPHGVFKSDFRHVFDEDRTRKNIAYRIRGIDQLSPIGFVVNQARRIRRVICKDDDWTCLYKERLQKIDNLESFVYDCKWLKFLCLNDLASLNVDKLDEVKRALDTLLEETRSRQASNCITAQFMEKRGSQTAV